MTLRATAGSALFRATLLCGFAAFAQSGFAQDASQLDGGQAGGDQAGGDQAGAGQAEGGPVSSNQAGLGDIVVTARFRNENLQSTPLSVVAVQGETLAKYAITDVASVQRFLPNVQLSRVNFSGNTLGASIRGVSFADLEKTFDPAIGVAIDGVFLGTNTGANIDFSDIESIEVLRGPQGTLYGRNTIGGTISVRRTRPTGEMGAKVHARYGSYGAYDLDGIVNLPQIGDFLSVKLFGLYRQSDSFTRNRYTGDREPGRDYWNVGGAFKFDFGENTSILASVDYQKDRSFYPSAINLTKRSGAPPFVVGNICDLTNIIGFGDLGCDTQGVVKQRGEDFKIANTSIPFKSWLDGWNSSLEINTKLGDWAITAITGYRDTNDLLLEENTGTPPVPVAPGVTIPLFVAARDQTYKQFSQEIRVSGDLTDWMDIVAGVYYLHTDYAIRPAEYLGARNGTAFLLNGVAQRAEASQKLDSYAIFLESIFKLGEKVRLTVGGRYTTETKTFQLDQTAPTAFSAGAKETWSDPTGRVILDWTPVDDMMFYGSWSRGFRSGGFNGRATAATAIGPYDPERVDSYEAGMKADFWDGRIRVNPTVFWAEYTNKQEEVIRGIPGGGAGTETIVENAAEARIRGLELELQAKPNPDLLLRFAMGYLDAQYKSFLIPDRANPGQFLDVADQRNFRRAPEITFTMGADYTIPLNDSNEVNIAMNYSFMDDIYTSPQRDASGDNRDIIPAFGTLDASISLLHTSGGAFKNFRLNAYGRDLLNDGGRLSNTLDAGFFWFGVVSPRRELGIEATINF